MPRGRPSKRGRVYRNDTERRRAVTERARANRDEVRAVRSDRPNLFRRIADGDFDENDFPEFALGPMNVRCQHCDALHFRNEAVNGHFNICCHNGIISLPEPRVNADLQNMFSKPDFMTNIRTYNCSMAFASLTASTVDIPGRGAPCFKIQGQLHRYISDVLPSGGKPPSYGQLYFIDTSTAMDVRQSRKSNEKLDPAILAALGHILSNNPYAKIYKQLAEKIIENPGIPNFNLRFVDNVSMDKRFNKPTADEVAGIFSSSDGAPPGSRHIVVEHRQQRGRLKTLPVISPHCDPMLYPLLFPYGEPGWDPSMKQNGPRKQAKRDTITMLQFACHRLADRNQFSHILQGKKLFQQYAVDLYVRVEGERLDYIREHQDDLRVEHYAGLQDFVVQKSQQKNMSAGKIVVLPSSFQGSPRNMAQRYQDAMALVRVHGKPDLFLTFTCNRNWPEIKSELRPNQTYLDRPDMVSRVFHSKFEEFKKDVLVNQVFGVVVAYTYVIEFQKRGLPHAHMLLILDENSKIKDASQIDDIVCAELPDPNRHPKLYATVLSCMIHGPCGTQNPDSPCMKNGECSKKYPKDFNETTILNENGYPIYRRRENGITAQVGVHEVDSRNVVPYNPFLLLKYNAHINVEICCSIRSIKYLFKYIYKGHDCACIKFTTDLCDDSVADYDEIDTFLNMRYVSPPEALWHLHSYKMHDKSHVIVRLAVHENGHQNVYFHEGREEEALQVASQKNTTLTAWFQLNRMDHNAHQYLYSEIPKHYRFDGKKWSLRKLDGCKIIGRMYGVAPNDFNRFYLRMLLLHVKGATSYEDLKTHEGKSFATFKESLISRGLLEDDREWHQTLEEMCNVKMPKQLRQMFAYICCFCEPKSPQDLWNRFEIFLTEDMEELSGLERNNKALLEIDEILRSNGFNCGKIGLPVPSLETVVTPRVTNPEEDTVRANEMITQMNDEQKCAFSKIMDSVTGKSKENVFFLEAPGGSGKTFLFKCIISVLKGQGKIALASAFTGIAALLLPDGTTCHRLFGLPVPLTESSISNISSNSEKAMTLRNADLLVIDESSMLPFCAVDCMDRLLRDLMKTVDPRLAKTPMGGKTVIFGGNFMQILPVVLKAGKVQIVESCFQSCKLWNSMTKLRLRTNMRANLDERAFSDWLLQLGSGQLNSNERGQDFVTLPPELVTEENSIISYVYGESLNELNSEEYVGKVIVTPKNEDCFELNGQIIEMLTGKRKDYNSVDAIISDDPVEQLNIPLEYLNSITPSGMPPHKLTLKVGAIVMLIRNMNLGSGLVNGVRCIVRGMFEKCLKLEIITGIGKGSIILLPRIKLISQDPNMPFKMTRLQFPIRVAFAMTINKSQGQTFDKIGIYLPNPVFAHGQLYVALSRVRSPSDVKIFIKTTNEQGISDDGAFTKNIVYTELLF